ncbi:DNA polymerase-3 subunit epsilon [Paenibacillus cellulosilyticus]|uniref:DNA polymerase-3 subunit epsilon n=1 Tax=Paenibacillus cellulosilyticus TaxID=375489 RepID=A0A2V2YIG4_9BACL|nr:3'-5' exonuclease [Paenibacillus cellulosilyticus]PWV87631.1 DNA polymerase-3 subunit epsilon [Paenibacillus cellulosilyticus]QKS44954.1 3'-5' exonuclease [Paenibacillus cellulosilyticus]
MQPDNPALAKSVGPEACVPFNNIIEVDLMEMKFISNTEYIISGVNIKDIEKQRFCIFDFESTGINHETEYITQIGAVIIENGCILENKTFNTYIKSPKPIPEAVERFTGIYNSDLEDAPFFKDKYNAFLEFTKDCIVVTHAGYEFDLPLLLNECKRNNLQMLTNISLDTKALFSYLHPEVKEIIWTDYLIKYYNIHDKDLRRHDALGDSILIGRIFLRILEEFQARDIKDIEFNDPVVVKRFEIIPMV